MLRWRSALLRQSASFFRAGGGSLRGGDPDPDRRGMLLTSRATSGAECDWLRGILGDDDTLPAAQTVY